MSSTKNTDRLQRLVDVWPEALSLNHAFELAGITVTDQRTKHRIRIDAENYTGKKLEAHNPKHSTENETLCPSTLDLVKAKNAKGIIACSYTNNTNIVDKFLDTLEVFAKAKHYQILVKPVRYRNPTSISTNEDYHWDKRIIPYAINQDFHLNSSLVFSSVSLQATCANPLAGKQIAYKNKSVVYGGSALEVDSVATPKNELPKLLFSTGSLNNPKYSNSDAGIKSTAKHSVSAIIFIPVGTYNRDYILQWDGTGFSFFDEYWTPQGLHADPVSCQALHFGDAHAEGVTKLHIKQRMRLIDKLNPKKLVWNDLHNHGSGSHHNTMIEDIKRFKNGTNCVKAEVQKSIDIVNQMGAGRENIIVRSNHHDHLDQWLNRFDPRRDVANAEYYFWLMEQVVKSGKSPLEIAMQQGLTVDYIFVNGDEEYDVAGVDVSQHGDKGADGARSAVGLHKLSRKIQSGHTHKRWIKGLHWTSGVIPLELGYNKGYGTWSSTDTMITSEGTRTHITFINGKFWK